MSSIDMQSILTKAKKAMGTSKFQKQIEAKVDDIMMYGGVAKQGHVATIYGTSMAAAKFIEVLQNEIKSNAMADGGGGLSGRGLGATAVSALTKLQHGDPVKVGKNRYQIAIWFSDDLHRDSLAPDQYDGVENIAALLNKGYSAANTVYGTWPGHGYASYFNIPSLQHREGLHFVENAIREYMANYAKEYGVIDIDVDDAYK